MKSLCFPGRPLSRLTVLAVLALILLGCQTVPVYDIVDEPVVAAVGGHSREDVRRAIFRAGASLGWRMENYGDGHILATLNQRDTMAQTDIRYDRHRYSIRYRDSSNLKYDGRNIRGGYNRWIRNLDKRIKTELAGL